MSERVLTKNRVTTEFSMTYSDDEEDTVLFSTTPSPTRRRRRRRRRRKHRFKLPDWNEATSTLLKDFSRRRRKEREREREMRLMDMMMNSDSGVKTLLERTERIESHTEAELKRLAEEVSRLKREAKTTITTSTPIPTPIPTQTTIPLPTQPIDDTILTIQTLRNCLDELAEKIETTTTLDVEEIQDDTLFKSTIEDISKQNSEIERVITEASKKLRLENSSSSLLEKIRDESVSRSRMILGTEIQGVMQACNSIVKLCMQRGEFQRQCWCAIVSKLKSSYQDMKIEMEKTKQELENATQNTKTTVESKQQEIENLNTQISKAQEQISVLAEERDRYRSELDRERVEHSRAQIQTRDARTKLSATMSTLQNTRKILKESEEEFSKISKVNVKLIKNVDALKKMHRAEQNQHRVEMKEIQETVVEKLRQDIETLRQNAKSREEKHESTIREMRKRHRVALKSLSVKAQELAVGQAQYTRELQHEHEAQTRQLQVDLAEARRALSDLRISSMRRSSSGSQKNENDTVDSSENKDNAENNEIENTMVMDELDHSSSSCHVKELSILPSGQDLLSSTRRCRREMKKKKKKNQLASSSGSNKLNSNDTNSNDTHSNVNDTNSNDELKLMNNLMTKIENEEKSLKRTTEEIDQLIERAKIDSSVIFDEAEEKLSMDMLRSVPSSSTVTSSSLSVVENDSKVSFSTTRRRRRRRRRDTKEFREKMHSLRHKLRAHGYRGPDGMDLKREFEEIDSNKDGMLSSEEFRHCVKRLIPITEQDMEELLDVLDRNGNNMIEWSEFLIFVENQHDPSEDSRVVTTLLASSPVDSGGVLMLTSGSDGGKFLFG
jgi:hypothetical protein